MEASHSATSNQFFGLGCISASEVEGFELSWVLECSGFRVQGFGARGLSFYIMHVQSESCVCVRGLLHNSTTCLLQYSTIEVVSSHVLPADIVFCFRCLKMGRSREGG